MIRAVFLDRDGIINIDRHYVYKIEDFQFKDGIFSFCRYAARKGFALFIITNQSGIARSFFSTSDFLRLNKWMLSVFERHKIKISKVYFCPHHPEYTGKCTCRKPAPGMIMQARNEFDIDLSGSVLVGDRENDILAGYSAGVSKLYLLNNKVQPSDVTHCTIITHLNEIRL